MQNQHDLKGEVICGFKVSSARKKLWALELDMLSFLESTCLKNNLDYFLLFGSAIGAVRHKGFIPWDDDIDIGMLRKDFEVFLKCDKSDWPDYIEVQYGLSDDRVDPLLRIRDKRTTGILNDERKHPRNKGVFIEIYPFDYVKNNTLRKVQLKASSFLLRSMDIFYLDNKELKGKRKLQKILVKVFGIKSFWNLYRWVCMLQSKSKDQYVDTIPLPNYAISGNHLFLSEDVQESIFCDFEYTKVRIPKGYDRCLTTRYGNYMELPPIEQRGTHHNFAVFYDPYKSYEEYENSEILEKYFQGDLSLEIL